MFALFQFKVNASDNRNPEKYASATVLIHVNRNNYLPEFQGQPYEIDVTENTPVFTIVARDRDIQVKCFSLWRFIQ